MSDKISDGRLLSRAEVEEHFGLSVRYLEDLAAKGEGPAFFKRGKMVRYKAGDVRKWIEQHTTGADHGAAQAIAACMAADLPLRILTALKPNAKIDGGQINSLIDESEAACEKLAMKTLELAERKDSGRLNGRQLSQTREAYAEVRTTEAGMESHLASLRELAKNQA